MPTRLPVLLHRRRSAAVGSALRVRGRARSAEAMSARTCDARSTDRRKNTRFFRGDFVIDPSSVRFPNNAGYRGSLRAVNEDRPEIIDIGAGWPGGEQIAKAAEEFSRIVVGK